MDDPLADLSADERKALAEIAKARANGEMSRRDMLKGLGILGAGAAVGGGGMAATGTAEAATVGDDPTIGDQAEPWDAWLKDVDAESVATRGAQFDDVAADPTTNGEVQRNGTDIKAYSGGAVRNLSNIGSGGGDVSVSDDGTQVVSAASDLNFVGISVTDDGDSTVTIGDTIDMGTI